MRRLAIVLKIIVILLLAVRIATATFVLSRVIVFRLELFMLREVEILHFSIESGESAHLHGFLAEKRSRMHKSLRLVRSSSKQHLPFIIL